MPPNDEQKAADLLACYGEKDSGSTEYIKGIQLTNDEGRDFGESISDIHLERRTNPNAQGGLIDKLRFTLIDVTPQDVWNSNSYTQFWNVFMPEYQYWQSMEIDSIQFEHSISRGSVLIIEGHVESDGYL